MSSNRSNRKAVPQLSNPSSNSMFYNYSPSMSFSTHQPTIRSPLAEDTDVKSPDFVWEAEYQDKMTVLKNSISQVPSTEKRQINFHFIDDMKATFDLKSLHSKKKRPTAKQVAADNKAASRKERKGALKQLPEPSKKRRPRNAFILYRTVLQAKAEFKGKTQTELSRLIAACWQNEPPETRAHFERAAELEKAFGYGATDVFNIKVGPSEKEWDAEDDSDPGMHAPINSDMEDSTFHQSDYGPPVNYPMYMPPFSPPFDHPHQDPYQIQASFQMLGSPYTDPPVYAGTPCGQINLSPQQAMFPFNTFPIESTPDQSAPMSPQEYDRSPSTFYATTMEHSTSNIPPSESFTLQTSAPEVSDIPADYSAFDNYHVDYSQNGGQADSHSETMAYSNTTSNETFQTYGAPNTEMFSPTFHTSHHSLDSGSTTENGIYMQSQYPVNDQTQLDGYLDLGGQMFENSECFTGHSVPHYQ